MGDILQMRMLKKDQVLSLLSFPLHFFMLIFTFSFFVMGDIKQMRRLQEDRVLSFVSLSLFDLHSHFFVIIMMGDIRGGQNPHKNPKIRISKMQPKIVVMLVLGTPKHLELGLKLQN